MSNFFDKLKTNLYAETYFEQILVIYSDREAVIENVNRIIETNEICIRFVTHLGETAVWGRNLCVVSYVGSRVKISGQITSCEISRRYKDAV